MSIINNGLLLASGADAATTYQISRSLRFNSADSAYLSRTPGSAGNRKTYTFSCWLKRSKLGTLQYVIQAYGGGTYRASLFFDTDDTLYFALGNTSPAIRTNAVFRDVSAWYHIVLAIDTTQSTQTAGMKLYVNGTQQTVTNSGTYTQNDEGWINSTSAHQISGTSGYYLDGYLADVYFLDGTATAPSTFAETDAITGQWVPKTPTGISYGTNGFRLTFSDNSGTTSTTLGKDAAGSNNWTPNNFSVASGSGNDSLVDSPTSYGTDAQNGGEVRGNYCTLNPLNNAGASGTYSNGNLEITTGSSQYGAYVSTIATPTSGKWYAEAYITSGANTRFGFVKASYTPSSTEQLGNVAGTMAYRCDNGDFRVALTTKFTGGATCTSGDTVGLALDNDNGEVKIYKNGSLQGTATGIEAANWCFAGSDDNGAATATHIWNFGQRAWSYAPPSGYKALVDTNLTAPTIAKPANYFDVKLYTGNGSSITVSGLNFSPDFIWGKNRSATASHEVYDTIRGVKNGLLPNSTIAELTNDATLLTAFNSDGFTYSSNTGMNGNGNAHVAWCWDAASSNTTDTTGSITSTRRTNATSGCSVVTYTGNGTSGATIGHGCNAKPGFVIVKSRSGGGASYYWICYHSSLGATKALELDTTDAAFTAPNAWNNTEPTSTLLTLGGNAVVNGNGSTYVAYCFSPVTNYSAFGSYTGNGSTDGPFVFTGHRTRFLLYKRSDVANDWYIMDTARDTYNVSGTRLFPNLSNAEYTYTSTDLIDVTANGFKIRSSNAAINANGGTYIYMALAESPFQYARAR